MRSDIIYRRLQVATIQALVLTVLCAHKRIEQFYFNLGFRNNCRACSVSPLFDVTFRTICESTHYLQIIFNQGRSWVTQNHSVQSKGLLQSFCCGRSFRFKGKFLFVPLENRNSIRSSGDNLLTAYIRHPTRDPRCVNGRRTNKVDANLTQRMSVRPRFRDRNFSHYRVFENKIPTFLKCVYV